MISCSNIPADVIRSSPCHAPTDISFETLASGHFLLRDPVWTESIAVGSEPFVMNVVERTRNRVDLDVAMTAGDIWTVRERESVYESVSGLKTTSKDVFRVL